jgi:hypothetical protein
MGTIAALSSSGSIWFICVVGMDICGFTMIATMFYDVLKL